jgi:hypothetical protein
VKCSPFGGDQQRPRYCRPRPLPFVGQLLQVYDGADIVDGKADKNPATLKKSPLLGARQPAFAQKPQRRQNLCRCGYAALWKSVDNACDVERMRRTDVVVHPFPQRLDSWSLRAHLPTSPQRPTTVVKKQGQETGRAITVAANDRATARLHQAATGPLIG